MISKTVHKPCAKIEVWWHTLNLEVSDIQWE